MSEGKDPAIKLFGKTIQLPEILPDCAGGGSVSQDGGTGGGGDGGGVKSEDRSSSSSSSSEANSKGVEEEPESEDNNKGVSDEKSNDKEEERTHSTISEEITDPNTTSAVNENPKTLSIENESTTAKTSKPEEEQSDTNNSQEKTLKKPDKILPCPRCNSMDTKFCYYNNYNVNQPRHFCKNCQRYWTAGGTMRNVPVGAGRRKNKTSAAQYRQITVTEPLAGEPNHPVLNPNGTVLTFGSDSPLCESMASVLQIADKTMMQNGFRKSEELRVAVPSNKADSKSSNGLSPQVQCFPGAPWPYPWAPQMGPGFGPPGLGGYPMPFYPPPPYWGCAMPVPLSVPGPGPGPAPWNMQWLHPPPTFQLAPFSGPVSPTLGKHSRDENMKSTDGVEEEPTKENEPEKSLWVPKTLRIDDPDEAAKSSIWATLGIKNDRPVGVNGGGGIFKAFQSKGEEKNGEKDASPALQANPAALSRSINFRETS